jgi:hypothetical protein
MVEDDFAVFDMTRSQVGRILGDYMMQDREHYQTLLKTLEEAMRSFFPEPEPEDKETKKAENDRGRRKKLTKQSEGYPIDDYFYLATVQLKISEKKFWRMTQRKFDILME